ncbi:hypothetical protein ACWIUD_08570 [Helicobacter sp. 23-1044]
MKYLKKIKEILRSLCSLRMTNLSADSAFFYENRARFCEISCEFMLDSANLSFEFAPKHRQSTYKNIKK